MGETETGRTFILGQKVSPNGLSDDKELTL
jgi:hypothetical protein